MNSEGDVVGTASRVEIDANGIAQARSEIVVWLRPHRGSGACDPQPFVLGGRDDLPFKQNPSINERGDVVARADLRNGSLIVAIHGVGWARCGSRYRMPFEMPVPEGFTDAYARDVNSRGEIVGTALVRGAGASTFTQGVVWSYRGGRWRTTLLANPAEGAGASTEQISDKGEVDRADGRAGRRSVGSAPVARPLPRAPRAAGPLIASGVGDRVPQAHARLRLDRGERGR